jgi:hypothetical protein
MPKTVYEGDKGEAERIRDRLKPSSGGLLDEWPPNSSTTTQPTRTVTAIWHGATQSSTTKQPLRSKPESVGAGTFFTDSEDDFNKTYGLNKPKGLRLNDASLFQRKR